MGKKKLLKVRSPRFWSWFCHKSALWLELYCTFLYKDWLISFKDPLSLRVWDYLIQVLNTESINYWDLLFFMQQTCHISLGPLSSSDNNFSQFLLKDSSLVYFAFLVLLYFSSVLSPQSVHTHPGFGPL